MINLRTVLSLPAAFAAFSSVGHAAVVDTTLSAGHPFYDLVSLMNGSESDLHLAEGSTGYTQVLWDTETNMFQTNFGGAVVTPTNGDIYLTLQAVNPVAFQVGPESSPGMGDVRSLLLGAVGSEAGDNDQFGWEPTTAGGSPLVYRGE